MQVQQKKSGFHSYRERAAFTQKSITKDVSSSFCKNPSNSTGKIFLIKKRLAYPKSSSKLYLSNPVTQT